MNNNIDLNALWQQQPGVPVPDAKALFLKATSLKRKTRNKLLITNILLLLTCAFVGFIGWAYHPKMITTKIGILLMVVAMVTYLAAYNRIIPLLLKNNVGASTHDYLQQFIRIKQRQEFLFKTMLSIYYILLSAGLFLYLIEVAGGMSLTGKIMAYGITASWILLNWFYIRPRTIRKQQAPLDAMIAKLQNINKQFIETPDDAQ